jgi:hypothetical protein
MAKRIESLWLRMILETKYPNRTKAQEDDRITINLRHRVTTYDFSMPSTEGPISGHTISPEPGTKTALLSNIANTLTQTCQTDTPESRTLLENLVTSLESRMTPLSTE